MDLTCFEYYIQPAIHPDAHLMRRSIKDSLNRRPDGFGSCSTWGDPKTALPHQIERGAKRSGGCWQGSSQWQHQSTEVTATKEFTALGDGQQCSLL